MEESNKTSDLHIEVNSDNENDSSYVNMPSGSWYNSKMIENEDGETVWIPDVADDVRPAKGNVYDNLDDCIKMYETYAYHAGFDTRLSTQKKTKSGIVVLKYIVCNKQGNPQGVNIDTLNSESTTKRSRIGALQVTGCEAHIIFKLNEANQKYVIAKFEEIHNHELNSMEHRHLSKKQRKLGIPEMQFIQKVSTSNIGATRAHHIYSNIQGSQQNTHGTIDDFKNYRKRINCFIGSSDSQMLINKMENRRKCVPNFTFEYKVMENTELECMFWADETAKLNFKEFGDIISFDATYRTNK